MILTLSCLVAAGVCSSILLGLRSRDGLRLSMPLPRERDSHERPTPRLGGLAIAGGLLAGVGVLTFSNQALSAAAGLVLVCSLGVGAIGLVDDLRGLGVLPRLLVQVVAAGMVVASLGGITCLPLPIPLDLHIVPAFGWAFSILWLVGVTNFFNFMDGINGIAGGQALITCLALAAVSAKSDGLVLSMLVASAVLVFLVFNWSPASVFLGDMGSFFLGFFLAASPWIGPQHLREKKVLLVAVSLGLFLLDPVWTLARRALRSARLTQAHREHLYQCLAAPPRSHAAVAAVSHGVAIVVSALAVWGFRQAEYAWVGPGALAVFFALEVLAVSVQRRRRVPVEK